ncbi:MAG: methylmalonyl-CoA mutase family protein [Ignavibacteria bacterium]
MVNEFTNDKDEHFALFKVDETARKSQIEKLKKLKEKRDNNRVEKALSDIKEKALTDENLLPFILEAVESYATIGEISNALREVWGEYSSN